MATVTKEIRGNWRETDRRVRHPLHAVRGWIRQYVILEGVGLSLLYLSVAFWVGVGFDWGLFQLLGVDWVQLLQGLTKDTGVDLYVRGLVLTLVVLGLAGVAVTKTLMRLFREFSDQAMALLLERRFPRELGDRLITAVELADPRMSEKYGFSLPLTEKTIKDAADRVERLPVRGVFNWARLRWIYTFCIGVAVGIYVVAGSVVCIHDGITPLDFYWRFTDVAAIWTDRNVLLEDIHWPRQAYLEVLGFRASDDNPNEMNIGSGEQRDQLHVRAFKWLKMATTRKVGSGADESWVPVPGGWTPLMWADLEEFFSPEELALVTIKSDWNGWKLDPYDQRGDWRLWTVDQVWRQHRNDKVREKMQAECGCNSVLLQIFERLEELADEPGLGRRIRAVNIPETVMVYSSNKSGRETSPPIMPGSGESTRFGIGFGSVPSTTIFTVNALDFYTPEKTISVIPPPSLLSLTVDKLEPAYVYYRLRGVDQGPLKGVKHVIEAEQLSRTGTSLVKVASGSDVVLRGELADVDQGRRLQQGGVTLRAVKDEERLEGEKKDNAPVPLVHPVFSSSDATGFIITLTDVVITYDFVIEFRDKFNAVGKRRVRVEAKPDDPPEVALEIEHERLMRRPRMRGNTGAPVPQSVADAWLVTPDAVLPLRGRLRDDYGLTDGKWVVRVELTDVEFSPPKKERKEPARSDPGKDEPGKDGKTEPVKSDPAKLQNARLEMPLRKYLPSFVAWEKEQEGRSITLDRIKELNQAERRSVDMMENIRLGKYAEARPVAEDLVALRKRILGESHVDYARSLQVLGDVLDGLKDESGAKRYKDQAAAIDALPRGAVVAWPKRQLDDDFRLVNVRSLIEKQRNDKNELTLPRLKALAGQPQLHYMVYLTLSATDNNMERGTVTTTGNTPVKFIVVSEIEFLAQIAEEEEALSKRLERGQINLKSSRDELHKQRERLKGAPTFEDIRSRFGLAQTYLSEGSSATREVYKDYDKIKNHLYFNQAKIEGIGIGSVNKRLTEVTRTIFTPLENLVEGQPSKIGENRDKPNPLAANKEKNLASVDFPTVEAYIKRLRDAIENEKGPIPAGSLARRLEEAAEAEVQVQRVMDEVSKVLAVITGVVTESKLREMIVRIRKDEDDRAREFKLVVERIEKEILDSLK